MQSLAYSFWEQFTGIALMIGIMGIFKHKLNRQGTLAGLLSGNTYAAFVLHAPILVFICVNLKGIEMPLLLKFIILAFPALASCFMAAYVIRKIPLVKNIL